MVSKSSIIYWKASNKRCSPHDITAVQADLLEFIKFTRGFEVSLYQNYQKRNAQGRQKLLEDLKDYGDKMMADALSLEEMQARLEVDGGDYDFLLSTVRMISPPGKSSFVRDAKALLATRMDQGDLREHIPAAWKHLTPEFALENVSHVLKAEASFDPEEKIAAMTRAILSAKDGRHPSLAELVAELNAFLNQESREAGWESLQEILFSFVGRQLGVETYRDLEAKKLCDAEQLKRDVKRGGLCFPRL